MAQQYDEALKALMDPETRKKYEKEATEERERQAAFERKLLKEKLEDALKQFEK